MEIVLHRIVGEMMHKLSHVTHVHQICMKVYKKVSEKQLKSDKTRDQFKVSKWFCLKGIKFPSP